jgi:hypothetical protein
VSYRGVFKLLPQDIEHAECEDCVQGIKPGSWYWLTHKDELLHVACAYDLGICPKPPLKEMEARDVR